jgi:geranylgeranyl diphosphate synthase type II
MLAIKQCQEIINRHLAQMNLPSEPANLYDPIRYIIEMGGKRIRPALVLMGCNVFSDNIEQAVRPALAIEVFHNFTLMHDDIMDRSEKRRNQLTVHKKWNENIAILSGDAMLIKSFELLSESPASYLPVILGLFNHSALQVCEGQQLDMDFEKSSCVSVHDYIRMIELKTAVLLATSLKIGAILGDADKNDASYLYEFGKELGKAFQLQDDYLDVFGDPVVFGKDTGNDIVSNKKTILLVQALERATGDKKVELQHWLNRKQFIREEKIAAVRNIFLDLNLEHETSLIIKSYYLRGLEMLAKVSVRDERKRILMEFSDLLLQRNK